MAPLRRSFCYGLEVREGETHTAWIYVHSPRRGRITANIERVDQSHDSSKILIKIRCNHGCQKYPYEIGKIRSRDAEPRL